MYNKNQKYNFDLQKNMVAYINVKSNGNYLTNRDTLIIHDH